MSVLIMGMEMPESCDECDLCICYVREDGTEENYRCPITMYPIRNFDERHERCPLIPVPPHGDLIDRDAFMRDECNNCDGACESLPCDCVNCHADCRCEFMRDILDAPTVIPAEE